MTSSVPLSFVLVSNNAPPDPAEVIAAARQLGLGLTYELGESQNLSFRVEGGGNLIVGLMPAPHPDAATMPVGPTSPDPQIIHQHVGHYIVTAFGLSEDPRENERLLSIATAAMIRASPAVAAMLGDGAIFHRADFFASVVESSGTEIATEITVDITAAQEGEDRVSFLTHGLSKYEREEFYVTSSVTGTGALEYIMGLVRWMVADPDKVLPTGDTVGRTPEERIIVQRVPSPIDGKPPVIRLDMDTEDPASQPKPSKKSWFRRN